MSAAMDGSDQARAKAAARTSAAPERYVPVHANTSSSYVGSYPRRRSSATPRSNSSRENGLAGDTTAMRAPGKTAGGFRRLKARGSGLQVPRHFLGDAAMFVVAQHLAEAGLPAWRHGRREKTLLRLAVARKRIFGPLERNASI